MAFSYEIQKVIEKAQNLRFSEDFVLLMAPAGGLEPLAYCLGGSRSIQLSYWGINKKQRCGIRSGSCLGVRTPYPVGPHTQIPFCPAAVRAGFYFNSFSLCCQESAHPTMRSDGPISFKAQVCFRRTARKIRPMTSPNSAGQIHPRPSPANGTYFSTTA